MPLRGAGAFAAMLFIWWRVSPTMVPAATFWTAAAIACGGEGVSVLVPPRR